MAHKKLTITLDEAVYDGLYRTIGRGKMSQYIEDLLRPNVMGADLRASFAALALDEEHNREAAEWDSIDLAEMQDEAW